MIRCSNCLSEYERLSEIGEDGDGVCCTYGQLQLVYANQWWPHSLNKSFWEEVLVGRTIAKLNFDEVGLSSIVLDDGQELFITHVHVNLDKETVSSIY